jgi:hypothetical protein
MYSRLCFLLLALSLSARADYFNFKGDPTKDNPMDSNEGGTAVGTTLGLAKAALEHGAMKENWKTWVNFEGTSATGEKLLPPGGVMGSAAKILDKAGPVIDHAGWMSTTAGEVAEGHFTQGLLTAMNGIAKSAATGIASTIGASVGSLGGPAGTVAGGAAAGYAASTAWDATIGDDFEKMKKDLGRKEDAAQIRGLASDKMDLGSDPDKTLAETHAKYLAFIQARKDKEKADADQKIAVAQAAEAAKQLAATKAAEAAKAAAAAKLAAEAKAAADAKKLADAKAAAAAPKVAPSATVSSTPPAAAAAPAAAQEPVRQMLGLTLSWGPLPEGMICYPGKFAGNKPPAPLPNKGELELFRGAVLYCQKGADLRQNVVVIELFVSLPSEDFPSLAEYAAKAKAEDPHGDFNFVRHVETTLGGRPGYESVGDGGVRSNRFFRLNLDPTRRIVAVILCEIRPGAKRPEAFEPLQRDFEAALKTFRFGVSGQPTPAK